MGTAIITPRQLSATIVVAASNSKEPWRASWDDTLGRYLQCDGAADNVEIQAALNALPINVAGYHVGRIVLLEGDYYIAAAITVEGHLSITGAGGPEGVALHLANGANCSIFVTTGGTRWVLSTVFLDGNKANQGVAAPLIQCTADNANFICRDCVILYSKGDGIRIDEGHECVIDTCQIEYHDGYGIHLNSADVGSIVIRGCLIHTNPTSIYCNNVEGIVIADCPSITANVHGIHLTGTTKRVNIVGNKGIGGVDSIHMDGTVQFVTISGNGIFFTVNIAAAAVDYIDIVGNTFYADTLLDPHIITIAGGNLHGIVKGNSSTEPVDVRDVQRVKNTSGGPLNAGDVVVLKAVAAGNEVTTTAVLGDDKVWGMLVENIADDAWGGVLVEGKTTVLNFVADQGAVAIGDFLTCNNVAGEAALAVAGNMAFAIALEISAIDTALDALIIKPRKI